MKAILEFDLNDPDDFRAHMRAVKSTDMAFILWEIQVGNFRKNILRELDATDQNDKTMEDGVYLVLDRLIGLLDEHSVDVQDLVV